MKKIALIGWLALVLGCNGLQLSEDAAMMTAIELGGYNLGYYVGHSKTDTDDIAIADAYKLARTGSLTPAEISQAFVKLKIDNPQLAGSLFIVLKNMGASFDTSGGLVSLSGIPVSYWDAAASGYQSGYAMGKAGKKSAVRALK